MGTLKTLSPPTIIGTLSLAAPTVSLPLLGHPTEDTEGDPLQP